MRFRRTFPVTVERWQQTGVDAHGAPVGTFVPEDILVYGIGPAGSQEPEPGRPLVVDTLQLVVPSGTIVGPADRVLIDGARYTVEGVPADWSRGPFGFDPGAVMLQLRRAEEV